MNAKRRSSYISSSQRTLLAIILELALLVIDRIRTNRVVVGVHRRFDVWENLLGFVLRLGTASLCVGLFPLAHDWRLAFLKRCSLVDRVFSCRLDCSRSSLMGYGCVIQCCSLVRIDCVRLRCDCSRSYLMGCWCAAIRSMLFRIDLVRFR